MAGGIPMCKPPDQMPQVHTNGEVINVSVVLLINGSHYTDYGDPVHQQSYSTLTTEAPADLQTTGALMGWFEIVLLLLCLIGVSGNMLNLLVLTRRRFCSCLNQLESSANYGLVALALSDLGFCLMALPYVFMAHAQKSNPFFMHYRLYGVASINLFLMISTWIIIIIAVNRWIVVVYPLKAKSILSQQSTIFCILLVYTASVIFTLPYFLHISIQSCYKTTGEQTFEFYSPYSDGMTIFLRFYIRWLWPIIADFIPLFILCMCNIRLIWEIRKTTSNSAIGLGRRSSHRNLRTSGSKVTVTLLAITIMYLVLVTPCEIMKYINPYRSWGKIGFVVANVTNVMQTANFAFNFVLYCMVNATFRQTLKDMLRPGRATTTSVLRSTYSARGESIMSRMDEKQVMILRRNSKNFTVISSV